MDLDIFSKGRQIRFPRKLWKITNECKSEAISWNVAGTSIILRYSLFQEEFLTRNIFKTENISSFVRQLNLYGFRKIYEHSHKQPYKIIVDVHEFSNDYFQRDRPDLLDKIVRKSGFWKDRHENSNGKCKMDDINKKSCQKLKDITNICAEIRDHSYIITQRYEPPNETPAVSEKAIANVDNIEVKTDVSSHSLQTRSQQTSASNRNCFNLAKKKIIKNSSTRSLESCYHRIYYNSVLKNPENDPHLLQRLNFIYFNDDDVCLRNTSCDVILSSIIPFPESPEYVELKESCHKLYNPKLQMPESWREN